MLTEGMFIDDRYEIVGKIGAGGMSDVYKAKDHTLGRFVAIKVLKQEFSEDVNFVTKFRTEAQSAAGLEHPNIVNIYDVGSQEGMYYIIMEYVEGITLKTYIEKKGQLTFKEAISIAIQVGRGIEAAHKKNITDGDWVVISTKRGCILQKAILTETIDHRVINCEYGWWYPEASSSDFGMMTSNVNVLTSMEEPLDPAMGTYQLRGLLCDIRKAKPQEIPSYLQ